ncbi:MAG: serine/threonine protein kinase [Cyanobacteria bacterium HKST-UBA02]|nr:serine/threonine protein kinase [Cyanobacteria bacterium HKST-UBA02]
MLGSGKTSDVYLAEHLYLDTEVALKLFRLKYLGNDRAMARTQQEARTCAGIKHPKIVAVSDFGLTESGAPYIVQEYIQGRDLHSILKEEGELERRRALDLIVQICEALCYLHSRKILHRDIKAANILVLREDQGGESVKLIDLGVARPENTGGAVLSLTQSGEIFGSPYYMSPEQCQSETVDERSDIYSLGCLAYEILTGSPPFRGGTILETLNQQIKDQPEPLSSRRKGEPAGTRLEAAVMRCLEKSPEDRFASAESLLEELNFIREHGKGRQAAGGRSIYVSVAACFVAAVLGFTAGRLTGDGPVRDAKKQPGEEQVRSSRKHESREGASTDLTMTCGRAAILELAHMPHAASRAYREGLEEAIKEGAPDREVLYLVSNDMRMLAGFGNYSVLENIYKRAEPLLERVRKRVARLKSAEYRTGNIPAIYYWSAMGLYEGGNFNAAETRMRRALEMARYHDDAKLLVPYYESFLGLVMLKTNQVDEGNKLIQEANGKLERILGSRHPMKAQLLLNTARGLEAAGDHEGAREALKQMQAILTESSVQMSSSKQLKDLIEKLQTSGR